MLDTPWHDGAPPSVGWWCTRAMPGSAAVWGYHNGVEWLVFIHWSTTARLAAKLAAARGAVQWSPHWPANCTADRKSQYPSTKEIE